jgi:hypothetical protein
MKVGMEQVVWAIVGMEYRLQKTARKICCLGKPFSKYLLTVDVSTGAQQYEFCFSTE